MDTFHIDQELFRSIPADLMLRYGFVPHRRVGKALEIVVSDPTDLPMIDELGVLLSTPIKVAVGPRSAIESILKKSESSQRVLEDATESFQLQLLKEEDNGEESLTVERLTSDISPVIRLVDSTIYTAIQRRASDIHIETQDDAVHVKYRIDGVLQPAMRPIAKQFHSSIISRIKVMAELDIAEKRVPQDGRFKLRMPGKTIDFRVSIMPSVHGEDSVIRILDKESISEQFTELRLDILGFPELELKRFRKYIAEPYGMVLVTGPTGSGKTTTLYAALSEIKSIEDKIVTIEDPVEYQLRGITQIPINEKKGLTFARGLRSILRHDPDKIMVGEIRDNETAQIAINSALTGHLVFTTVHANNVLDVLGRFLNMGVEAYQFVSALNCVMAQRLVRTICTHCKRRAKVTRALARGVGARSRARAHASVLRGSGLHRMRRHRLQGPHGHLRAARPERSHSRADSREAADVRDQESGARRRHALPARIGRRARHERHDDVARDQQGDVRRMNLFSSLREAPAPGVAVELAASRVSGATLDWRGGQPVVAAHAVEPLPEGALVPSLTAANTHDRAAVTTALNRVMERLGRPRRIGLVVPDVVAKVSILKFEKIPARAQDLDQLVRWQVRKAAPFPIEEAQVSFVNGQRAADGQELIVSLARRSVIEEYEQLCAEAGAYAGLVDLATFNVINAVLAGRGASAGGGSGAGGLAAGQRRRRLGVDRAPARTASHLLPQPRGRHRRHARGSRPSDRDVLRGPAAGRRLRPRAAGRRRRHPRRRRARSGAAQSRGAAHHAG